MARRQQEETNHWPGFVDALSTIIMVVTFLLIILGIAIFVLSQKVAEDQISDMRSAMDQQREARLAALEAEVDQRQSEIDKLQSKLRSLSGSSTITASRGKSAVIRQQELVDGSTEIPVRSSKIAETKNAKVIAEEEEETNSEVEILSAASLITLEFDANNVDLDEASSKKVTDYVRANAQKLEGKEIEIRSLAASDVASVSEARRIAYYRAIAVRNSLLEAGIPAERIRSRIRPNEPGEPHDKVFVIAR